MNTSPSPATRRLERLESYLRQDPANLSLLADACEAAIAAGQHERALGHIATAERLAPDRTPWVFRRAGVCIARRDLEQADALLRSLRSTGDHPAVSHDLAYVSFLRADYAAARELVQPWLAAGGELEPEQREALQILWLRASHRLHLLHEAWEWSQQEDAVGRLEPRAKGPASLVAIDSSHFEAALTWSEAALAVDPAQVEALAARAYVAMAQQQPALGAKLLEQALRSNPEDGRTWSALGYASLQMQNLPLAQSQLERAVQLVPEHVGTWHALGWARLLQQDIAGALEAFRSALERDRNFAETHGAMGLVLALAGDKAQADHHLEVAQRLDPTNVTGRYARAVVAGEARDISRLAELAERLLDRPGFFGRKLSDAIKPPPVRH
ncbi:tetratricopeptide repeat protein [Ramlibacter pallidus]|uniref:Tetratricopeptide repeat protein n=1 Tax=Ramlibacter pallidus TaxID=2780087 RepID=A0ABR9S0Y1_9BURK|nr:tetratricopeptide repeat protein [Ramlibacter pallidus]MBE7367181.1 hypothetical protein [Ramlibacter pallidus]